MKTLTVLDDNFEPVFDRQMRCYLVKTEEQFTRLALAKYQQEMQATKIKSTSSNSNQRGKT